MGTESFCEAKLETGNMPSSIFVIFAPWEYHSKFGLGADYGRHVCVYSPARRNAIYLKVRDLVVHDEFRSKLTGRLRQTNEINARRDVWSRALVEAKVTLEEQIKYLRETRIEFVGCKAVVAQLPAEALDTLLDMNSNPQVVYNLLQEGMQDTPAGTETL